jgi:outer membrane scaffolding protein for murein synthesis (MipA/OmpV family)
MQNPWPVFKGSMPLVFSAFLGFSAPGQAENEFSLGIGIAANEQAFGQGWRALPAPSFSLKYEGFSLRTRGPGLAADLVPSRALSLGPLVRYAGGRSSDELPAAYAGQADIPASAEVGLSLGSGIPWRVMGVPLPGILTAGVDLVTTLPGGHETATLAPSLGWVNPVTDRMTLIGSLGSQWGTEANMSTFFGVSADPGTNVQAYQPKSGLRELSLSLIAAYQHTDRWSTIWLISASRYQGDAARSPLVQETDSLHRFFAVWGLSYRWSFE